jgi:hypothetical protein
MVEWVINSIINIVVAVSFQICEWVGDEPFFLDQSMKAGIYNGLQDDSQHWLLGY